MLVVVVVVVFVACTIKTSSAVNVVKRQLRQNNVRTISAAFEKQLTLLSGVNH